MNDVTENELDASDPSNILRLHILISSLIAKIGHVDIQTHYFRNNYAAGIIHLITHEKFDIIPYLKWGNSPNSPQKGAADIKKGVHLALENYKKNADSVSLYRKNLFGIKKAKIKLKSYN